MIKVMEDVGAPIAVTAVDLITETTAPDWNEWASYICAAGGYLGAWFNFGGDFTKNVGIASMPWAAKKIYNRVKGVSRRAAFRPTSRVSRYPAAANVPEFQGARLV